MTGRYFLTNICMVKWETKPYLSVDRVTCLLCTLLLTTVIYLPQYSVFTGIIHLPVEYHLKQVEILP